MNEVHFNYASGKTTYFVIRNSVGLIWNGVAFEAYDALNWTDYDVAAVEQGNSGFYTGNFPSAIPAGVYSVVAKEQLGGSPAENDLTIAVGELQWGGSDVVPLSSLAVSGQASAIRMTRGHAVNNFGIKLVSSADHVTPFTSGVVSGQIARDGGNFTVLQSGAFTEIGLGWYNLLALTSGDLLANTAKLVFTATGVSGGQSDQRDLFLVMQGNVGP